MLIVIDSTSVIAYLRLRLRTYYKKSATSLLSSRVSILRLLYLNSI